MQKIAVLTYIFLTVSIAKADTIVPASLINRPAPNFPASAGNIEGYVKMRFSIGLDGSVIKPVIIESKPARIFDKAAIDAVGRWTYQARTVNGRSVEQADNLIILRFNPI